MASSTARNVFFTTRAACLTYRGLRGDVVTSTANDFVGIVQNPAAQPVEIEPTPYVPAADNTIDLGTSSVRFRNGYFGTGLYVGADGGAALLSQPGAGQALLALQTATQGLAIESGAVNVNGVKLTTAAAGGTVVFEAVGSDADVALTIRQKGTDGLVLGTSTGGLALYGGTARAKPTGATALGAFTDPPSAAEMANLRTQFNAIVTALSTTAGVSLCTG